MFSKVFEGKLFFSSLLTVPIVLIHFLFFDVFPPTLVPEKKKGKSRRRRTAVEGKN